MHKRTETRKIHHIECVVAKSPSASGLPATGRRRPMTGWRTLLTGLLIAMLVGGAGQSHAQLPSLNEAPWFGFFAGHNGTRGMFGITTEGVLYYNHSADLENVNSGYFHRIHPSVEEARPDGEIVRRQLLPETLQTTDEPTTNPNKITFQGEVRGGTKIEVVVEFSRRDISVGGRIIEPAPGDRPQRFILHTQAPPFYLRYGEHKIRTEGTEEEKAELEKRNAPQRAIAARENLVLRGLDGRRVRQPILDEVDLSSPEFNGDGFNSIEIDFDALRGRKISITTTENSRMLLSNPEPRPIFKYFYHITWMEDPARRNAGTGRMVFSTR